MVHFLASEAARNLRPQCAHAKTQNRPTGGNMRVFPDDCSGFLTGNLLWALSTEAAVKRQKREPRGTVPFCGVRGTTSAAADSRTRFSVDDLRRRLSPSSRRASPSP